MLLPAALLVIALTVVVRLRGVAWPFVYTRVLGACALVGVAWAVFRVGRTVEFGVLLAGLGAAMVVGGSSAALSGEGQTAVPLRRRG